MCFAKRFILKSIYLSKKSYILTKVYDFLLRNNMEIKKEYAFGEIVESSLYSFTVKCWQWDNSASFGSLVVAVDSEKKVYGIVYKIKTESFNPIQTGTTYQKTENQMKEEFPHVFEFLETTCEILILGYQNHENEIINQYPSKLIKLYSFVSRAQEEEIINFLKKDSYVYLLTKHTFAIEHIEELLYAIIKIQKSLNIFAENRCISLLTQYATSQNISYVQLRHMVSKIEQL